MPWEECRAMSKKMEFVALAAEPGAKLAPLCRQFGISRQTGYKWLKRFREGGFAALEEQSRRPKSSPLSFGEELVMAVLETRDAHPTWGAKKIRDFLVRRFGERTPSRATVARMLSRFGRIRERRRRPCLNVVEEPPSEPAHKPNDVWTVDFKGWWYTQDGSRAEPLTVRDAFSRYVLTVTLTDASVASVREVFEELFRKYGLPGAIQCDNGIPFVSVKSRGGLSRLSAWWVSLGIRLVRSRPGCPQDNAAHERMHGDIAKEIESSPAMTLEIQQAILDKWRQEFNHVRPHDGIEGRTPGEAYKPSPKRFTTPAPYPYPDHFATVRVARNGVFWRDGDHYHVGAAFGGHRIGLEQLDELTWRIWFAHVDCGTIELIPRRFDSFVSQHVKACINRLERHDARLRQKPEASTEGRAEMEKAAE